MSSLDFCHWLKGVIDVNGLNEHLTLDKLKLVSEKLNLVFDEIQKLKDNETKFMPSFPFLPIGPNMLQTSPTLENKKE